MKEVHLKYKRDTGMSPHEYVQLATNHRSDLNSYMCLSNDDQDMFESMLDDDGDLCVYSREYIEWLEEQL